MFVVGKKGYSRGQFTIFVIIGLVVLFIFGFALYARIKIIQASVAQQADVQLKNYIDQNSINQYVTSCLDAVVDETVLAAAMQGGNLYVDNTTIPGPTVPYYDAKLNRTFNVSVTIDANKICPDGRLAQDYVVTQDPGFYPFNCRYEYIKELPNIYKTFGNDNCHNNCTYNSMWSKSGFFGVNNMKILCNGYGANAPGIVSNQNFRTCDYYDYKTGSLQELIERKISSEMDKCVNFTELLKKSTSNITMNGSVRTILTFGREEFNVNLEYPFVVTVRNRQPVTRMVNFTVNKQVPLKELYEYGYELSNSDVVDAIFDTFYDKELVRSKSARRFNASIYNSDFLINIIRGDPSNGYTDLIQIIDTDNYIRGVPLTINFAARNRRPALDYIHDGGSVFFDIATIENNTIILSPQAYDPDGERKLTYVYGGWRQDYIDQYNYDDPLCTEPESIGYVFANCTTRSTLEIPRNWTESKLYKNTSQNSSYDTKFNDVGFHTVTISVFDRQGLEDYQVVRILVLDLPVAEIKGSNMYDDVNDGFASYEDIYVLNASSSNAGKLSKLMNVSIAMFAWSDDKEPFHYNSSTETAIVLPFSLISPGTTNITDIINWPFKKTPAQIVEHEILLTVTTDIGLTDSEVLKVNVTQCLAHRSSMPSYPYDTLYGVLEADLIGHLEANHTCCSDGMAYYDTNSPCFSAINYGLEKNLLDYRKITKLPPTIYDITVNNIYSGSNNDIFMQKFTRFCSGERGNICDGRGKDARDPYARCDDTNNNAGNNFKNERCSGPPEQYIPSGTYSNSSFGCVNYTPGRSFERLSGMLASDNTAADSYCTQQPDYASGPGTIGGRFYDPSRPDNFLCRGQCDGAGGCTYPTLCTCKSNPLGDGRGECDGLNYSTSLQSPRNKICSGTGQAVFEDFCNSACGLVEDPRRICRASAYGTGCSADAYCNGVETGGYAKSNGANTCLGNIDSTVWTRCNDSCRYISANDNVCRAGNGCTAQVQCNGVSKDTMIPTDADPTTNDGGRYCTSSCQMLSCGAYAYNTQTDTCNTQCNTNSQCGIGYACCTTPGGCGASAPMQNRCYSS